MLAAVIAYARRWLPHDVRLVVELGARDCAESVGFAAAFPAATVYAFECNPATLPVCRTQAAEHEQIKLVERAVSDRNGVITFYPIDQQRTVTTWPDGNPGASSLFRATGNYSAETYVQDQITVPTTRLDTFLSEQRIDRVDILWMDIQGAELLALQGLGTRISDVSLIHTELELEEIYDGQPLFRDVSAFLRAAGFRLATFTRVDASACDAIFVNRSLERRWGRRLALDVRHVALPLVLQRDRLLRRWRGLAWMAHVRRLRDAVRDVRRIDVPWLGPLPRRLRQLDYVWLRYLRPRLSRSSARAATPLPRIDVVIPAAPKDLPRLGVVLEGLRRNCRHPLGTVHVIGPAGEGLEATVEALGARFVDEAAVLPADVFTIDLVVGGEDRSGWLLQQLIKLSADSVATTELFLVLDADTVLLQPFQVSEGRKDVLLHSEELHKPYFDAYERLLGRRPRARLSFVAHRMALRSTHLRELRTAIEARHGAPWWRAIVDVIDRSEPSCFSEFEVYGNHVLSRHRRLVRREHWRGLNSVASPDVSFEALIGEYAPRWSSVSLHDYTRPGQGGPP